MESTTFSSRLITGLVAWECGLASEEIWFSERCVFRRRFGSTRSGRGSKHGYQRYEFCNLHLSHKPKAQRALWCCIFFLCSWSTVLRGTPRVAEWPFWLLASARMPSAVYCLQSMQTFQELFEAQCLLVSHRATYQTRWQYVIFACPLSLGSLSFRPKS